MEKTQINEIKEDLMYVFHGLMYGGVSFNWSNCDCAMGGSPCEEFSSVAEDFVMKVEFGGTPTLEDIITLRNNLVQYNEVREIKELEPVIDKLTKIIEESK